VLRKGQDRSETVTLYKKWGGGRVRSKLACRGGKKGGSGVSEGEGACLKKKRERGEYLRRGRSGPWATSRKALIPGKLEKIRRGGDE